MVVDSPVTPSGGKLIDPELAPGQIVGEYVIEAKVGQGGFGTVFKAVHPLIGKLVAIKVLSQKFSVDPEMVSRFVAEARAVNQIRHHNIIDIFSFGALDDGRHYYVMEFLDGEPLDQRIRRTGQLALGEALPILRGIARAIDAAHAKGIAHRDLKAENVFLATHPDGVLAKLLDFGIAKLLGPEHGLVHKTRTGAPMGTPHYMSPEQCHGRDVDHRTDLYAFGVLAYVMLTGAYPIDGEDYMTILMRQIHDTAPPASSHRPELPAGVDRVIGWLMHKDPARRPPSLVDAVRELEQAASGAGAEAQPAWPAHLSSAETSPMVGKASEVRTHPIGPANHAREATPAGAPAPIGDATPAGTPARDPTPAHQATPELDATMMTPSGNPATPGPATPSHATPGSTMLGHATPSHTPSGNLTPGNLTPSHARSNSGPLAVATTVPADVPVDEASGSRTDQPAPRSNARVWWAGGVAVVVLASVAIVALRMSSASPAPTRVPPTQDSGAPPGAAATGAPAAATADVFLTIEGTPPDTEVRRGGALVGTAPGRVELPRSNVEVLLVLSADGFLPATLTVIPSGDATRSVSLTRKPAPAPPAVVPAPPAPAATATPANRHPSAPAHRPAGGAARPATGSAATPAGAPTGSPTNEPTNEIEQFPSKTP